MTTTTPALSLTNGLTTTTVADLSDAACADILDRHGAMMDDEIRETVHAEIAPCSPRAFLDAYCRRHLSAHGSPWTVG